MKKINFSHRYSKLGCEIEAQLLQVLPIDLKDLTDLMRAYDTHFKEDGADEFYKLPKSGKHLLLIFLGRKGSLFTTIRADFPSTKKEYYNKSVGEWFQIVLKP
jgi:hypothetical protein